MNHEKPAEEKTVGEIVADLKELMRDNYRPHLRVLVARGAALLLLKSKVQHGEWLPRLKQAGIDDRSAQEWMEMAREAKTRGSAFFKDFVSGNQFLAFRRKAKRAAARAKREEARRQAEEAAERLPPDKAYRVICADCRKYRWPAEANVIASDPPWGVLKDYVWLGRFASKKLKPGGLLLCQCGTPDLPEVLDVLRAAGLTYLHTLAIDFQRMGDVRALLPYQFTWKPVLMFSYGKADLSAVRPFSTCFTVLPRREEPSWHPWGQPISAWRFWLWNLTMPGDLVLDPFAGTGRIGRALKQVGGRRYLGVEIDPDHTKAALGDLLGEPEGTYRPTKDKP